MNLIIILSCILTRILQVNYRYHFLETKLLISNIQISFFKNLFNKKGGQ